MSYFESIKTLFPKGRLWEFHENKNLTKLVKGLAYPFGLLIGRFNSTKKEFFPQSASETIGDWESALGLEARGDLGLEARRALVLERLRNFEEIDIKVIMRVLENNNLARLDFRDYAYTPAESGSGLEGDADPTKEKINYAKSVRVWDGLRVVDGLRVKDYNVDYTMYLYFTGLNSAERNNINAILDLYVAAYLAYEVLDSA